MTYFVTYIVLIAYLVSISIKLLKIITKCVVVVVVVLPTRKKLIGRLASHGREPVLQSSLLLILFLVSDDPRGKDYSSSVSIGFGF